MSDVPVGPDDVIAEHLFCVNQPEFASVARGNSSLIANQPDTEFVPGDHQYIQHL